MNRKRWLGGYRGFDPVQLQLDGSKPRKKRSNKEDVEQIKFNLWFDQYLLKKDLRWFHSPNGGGRSQAEGAKFKRMGVKKGVPDIILPLARKSYHGLVIELKRVDGVPSDVSLEQRDWLDWFGRQGWANHVAYGFEEAKRIVEDYLLC